ncbi:MAG: hypothetical protein NZ480_04910 [Bdellovibrionaceae bacterium]|nr:hypothetical protein [Pseudobdellovibrionaceae bacterium]MDW8191112.1 hypothetical protein [Pseudobdellovibrionaceae bacterium]
MVSLRSESKSQLQKTYKDLENRNQEIPVKMAELEDVLRQTESQYRQVRTDLEFERANFIKVLN